MEKNYSNLGREYNPRFKSHFCLVSAFRLQYEQNNVVSGL